MTHFKCQQCANCCRAEGYVYVNSEELSRIADFLSMTPTQFKEKYVATENGWMMVASPTFRPQCFLGPAGKCTIYPVRPHACQTYPDWPYIWESRESLQNEAESCPGLRLRLNHLNSEQSRKITSYGEKVK